MDNIHCLPILGHSSNFRSVPNFGHFSVLDASHTLCRPKFNRAYHSTFKTSAQRHGQAFAIQDWKDNGDILMHHIPGVINPADSLTKPTGWVLHSRHCRRLMGHFYC
jgi:hypothetical protein